MLQKAIRTAVVAGLLAGSAMLVQSPAEAYTQTWSSSASYRASGDWLPAATSVTPEGKACSGGAAYLFSITILRTSGSAHVWTSPTPAWADGQWWYWNNVNVSIGTSYYFRWRGLDGNGKAYYAAPCQGVKANPTQ